MAMSEDGSQMFLAFSRSPRNYVYASTDNGLTWSTTSPSHPWGAMATNANGSHLIAAGFWGNVYLGQRNGTAYTWHRPSQPNWLRCTQFCQIISRFVD